MPVLDCTVSTCHYNVDERCSLGKIQVEGKNADTADVLYSRLKTKQSYPLSPKSNQAFGVNSKS